MLTIDLLKQVLGDNSIMGYGVTYEYGVCGIEYATIKCRAIDDCEEVIYWINIYELAFKAKEWAYEKRVKLLSFKDGSEVFKCIVRSDRNNEWLNETKSSTEQDAIFQACEFILEIKEQK